MKRKWLSLEESTRAVAKLLPRGSVAVRVNTIDLMGLCGRAIWSTNFQRLLHQQLDADHAIGMFAIGSGITALFNTKAFDKAPIIRPKGFK